MSQAVKRVDDHAVSTIAKIFKKKLVVLLSIQIQQKQLT